MCHPNDQKCMHVDKIWGYNASVRYETPTISKLPPKPGPGKGKGLMKGLDHVTEKHPVLLREDSGYALK